MAESKASNPAPRGKEAPKKYLSTAEVIRLSRWLCDRKNELLATRPKHEAVAGQAQKELGFDVTVTNLRNTARASDIVWHEVQVRKESGKPHTQHNKTRAQFALLGRRVEALRAALKVLCERLGEKPPDVVADMWPAADHDPAAGVDAPPENG